MLPIYYIRDVRYAGYDQAWLREHAPGDYVLDFCSPEQKPELQNSVCFTDPDEAVAAVIEASKQDIYGWRDGREMPGKKVRPELQVVKLLCAVYPMRCDIEGTYPKTTSAFIHADKGPLTYYALRETTTESYFYQTRLNGKVLRPLSTATLFPTHKKASDQLSRLLKWNTEIPLSSVESIRAKDLRWQVEKRYGFLVGKANPRMTNLLGRGEWRQTDFKVVPHLEDL